MWKGEVELAKFAELPDLAPGSEEDGDERTKFPRFVLGEGLQESVDADSGEGGEIDAAMEVPNELRLQSCHRRQEPQRRQLLVLQSQPLMTTNKFSTPESWLNSKVPNTENSQ